MAFKSYNTVNGMLVGEHDGERAVDYQTDALGSVVGTFRTTGTLQNTYRYAGYGQQVSKTGSAPDPLFLWVGGWGYRDGEVLGYARRRHCATQLGSWTSSDSLWPEEHAYLYVSANPTTLIDPMGLAPEPTAQRQVKQVGPNDWVLWSGKCCDFHGIPDDWDSCGGILPTPPCGLIPNGNCKELQAAFERCAIGRRTFCNAIDGLGCCNAAAAMGVSSSCLCAALAAERSFADIDPGNWCQDVSGVGSTFGCVQMSVGTAENILRKAQKCAPELVKKLKPPPPYKSIGDLLRFNCNWSVQMAALFLAVNSLPKCNGGKAGSCENFLRLWNLSNPEWQKRAKCALSALKSHNPCAKQGAGGRRNVT